MLEIACFNSASAILAAHAGANRIELCADYAAGGVTPSVQSLHQLKPEITIPINVMIRPRAGDFVYTNEEFEQMRSEIELFKPQVNGFVFGISNEKNQVDQDRNRALVELAAPLPCTFHRAFDQVPDMIVATEQLIQCGFKFILTSGGQLNAVAGAKNVADLQQKFGKQISFILGGGVRSSNIESLKLQTKVEWYHSAAITQAGESVDKEEVVMLQY
jgi:copper homeostasis protein